MRITFIKPTIGRKGHSLYVDEGRMEPLQLGVLAGLTPPEIECVLYDDRIEAINYDEPTDLVAITVEIYTARRAYEIAAEFRQRGVPVILGGFHPTLAPHECAPYADAIFIGDAETTWSQVIDDVRHGRLKPVYRGTPGIAQLGHIQPRREIFEGKGYLPITLVQFSRGCPYRCDFCAISSYFEHRHHTRPIPEVLDEIQAQKRRSVFFVDDNLLANRQAAKELLRALIPLKIRWVSQASIDMTEDPELMSLLVESGCCGNVIGFESLNQSNLKDMKKAPNLRQKQFDNYERQCEILRQYHLQSWAAFTIGHDHDTLESIQATSDFAMRQKFCFAAYNILMPYPNTPLYDRLAKENRLLWDGQWWLHPEYQFNHAAFKPSNMSPAELTQATWQCRYQWNRPSSVFKRLWDFKTHLYSPTKLYIYLKYNPLYARETFKKQDMHFGGQHEGIKPYAPTGQTSVKLTIEEALPRV
jgi:radical SAM superfamily enzyme YgiQ (UPF0313 family)